MRDSRPNRKIAELLLAAVLVTMASCTALLPRIIFNAADGPSKPKPTGKIAALF